MDGKINNYDDSFDTTEFEVPKALIISSYNYSLLKKVQTQFMHDRSSHRATPESPHECINYIAS